MKKKNILNKNFIHIKIGIRKDEIFSMLSTYVLENFSKTELKSLNFIIDDASFCILELLKKDINIVMNKYN